MDTIHPEAIDYLISVNFSDFNGAQKDILKKDFLDYSSNYIVATNTGTGKTALAQLRIVDTLKKGTKSRLHFSIQSNCRGKKTRFWIL